MQYLKMNKKRVNQLKSANLQDKNVHYNILSKHEQLCKFKTGFISTKILIVDFIVIVKLAYVPRIYK
jgi:hypothetical protein